MMFKIGDKVIGKVDTDVEGFKGVVVAFDKFTGWLVRFPRFRGHKGLHASYLQLTNDHYGI